MATYGFATGSNLTDLGRNLVAQESSRNALQAALAAAAAQQGVARTQAGASRYSTDAQREGNQLMAMLRGLENDRLREATGIDKALKERGFAIDEARDKAQFSPNTPAERDLDRKARIREAEIIAEGQRFRNSLPDQRLSQSIFEANFEIDKIRKSLPQIEAEANFKSNELFQNKNDWLTGDVKDLRKYQAKVFELIKGFGENGSYLTPTTLPDGSISFKANPPNFIPIPGVEGLKPLPLPPQDQLPPPPTVDEVESALEGTNVPRRTLPTPPVSPLRQPPPLPVADTEPGFFSKLGGLTDRSPIAQLAQLIGRSSVRSTDAPAAPVVPVSPSAAPPIVSLAETIRRQSPLVELVPIIDFDPGRTSRTSPNSAGEAESIVLGYIDNLAKEIQRLNQLPAQRGTESRKALVIQELSRLRQLMPSLN